MLWNLWSSVVVPVNVVVSWWSSGIILSWWWRVVDVGKVDAVEEVDVMLCVWW